MSSHPGYPSTAGAAHVSGLMPPSVVSVIFVPGPHRVLARVSGEIDTADAAGLRQNLTMALTASRGGLDIDLAAVTFCDSSGLHVLLDLNHLALRDGKTLVLTALSRPVALLLRLAGTHHVLTVHGWAAPDIRPVAGRPGPRRPGATGAGGSTPVGFGVKTRRHGSTVHLAPTGELDLDARPALDEVQPVLDGADVVACDMQHLTFVDVVGLHALLAFACRLNARGITFFTYNWQSQPRRLLDLFDDGYPPADGDGPARMLRRFRRSASAARAAGTAKARREDSRRTEPPPP
ncbi:STAS domain-containing protein [Streptomyces sp. NRRL B-24572]|uniref:STAS domain-containing protein n=1 Tax=Streptomyces sp. NRRL B-24572 TaxID=1962156 RepID=UPI000A3A9BA8|nr:STAS domain-containing protein [Streptomyces sp. NRRL B-24572]